MISTLITPHSSRLSLLAAPLEAYEAEEIKPEHVTEILHLVGQRFQCLVLDLQHTFDPVTVAALDLADDILLNQIIAFVKQVAVVQNSGFSVQDLRYLLRHQFDPVGIYQSDPNALIALVQTIGSGLSRIQAQNAVPSNLLTMPETLIDQSLSGLFPAAILKTLFTQLANSQTYTATATSAAALTAADFAAGFEWAAGGKPGCGGCACGAITEPGGA